MQFARETAGDLTTVGEVPLKGNVYFWGGGYGFVGREHHYYGNEVFQMDKVDREKEGLDAGPQVRGGGGREGWQWTPQKTTKVTTGSPKKKPQNNPQLVVGVPPAFEFLAKKSGWAHHLGNRSGGCPGGYESRRRGKRDRRKKKKRKKVFRPVAALVGVGKETRSCVPEGLLGSVGF